MAFGLFLIGLGCFFTGMFVGEMCAAFFNAPNRSQWIEGFDIAMESFTQYGWIVSRNGGINEIEVEDEHGNYHRYKRID